MGVVQMGIDFLKNNLVQPDGNACHDAHAHGGSPRPR